MRQRRSSERRGLALLVALLVLPLAGCGATAHAGRPSAPAKPTPTATATATAIATATPTTLPGANGGENVSIGPCDPALSSAPHFALGDLIVHMSIAGFSWPGRKLPDGTPLTPFKLAAPTGSALNAQLPLAPPVNPALDEPVGAYSLSICNTSKTKTHAISAISLSIASLTPYTGQLNEWMIAGPCATYYGRPTGVQGGGCGGGVGPGSNCMHASFAANAKAAAVVSAVSSAANSCTGDIPLPATLAPNQELPVTLGITPPTTPGTYSFALGIGVDGGPVMFSSGQTPILIAPVAHHWDGEACTQSAMQAQIPAATNPPTYYICPQS